MSGYMHFITSHCSILPIISMLIVDYYAYNKFQLTSPTAPTTIGYCLIDIHSSVEYSDRSAE